MNIHIPSHVLPECAESFDVTAEIDYIPDMIVDHVPTGIGDWFKMTPIYGSMPMAVNEIIIEAGGETFSSDQLKEIQKDIEDHMRKGDGWQLIN